MNKLPTCTKCKKQASIVYGNMIHVGVTRVHLPLETKLCIACREDLIEETNQRIKSLAYPFGPYHLPVLHKEDLSFLEIGGTQR